MKISFAILFAGCFISLVFGQKAEEKLETFQWQNVGSIEIPKGSTKEYYNYREGYIFTLKYKDGSFIKLHKGGMMELPFFQEGKEFEVEQSEDLDDKTIRCGKRKNKDLYWCEINFKRRKDLIFPPNLSFGDVKKKNLESFKNALKSFNCAICENKNVNQNQKIKVIESFYLKKVKVGL